MLLESESPGFNALIAPGHVSTVMGPEEWSFVAEKHQIPAAVAGFNSESLLAAMYSVLRQVIEEKPFLDNCYANVAKAGGNPTAKSVLEQVLEVTEAGLRAIRCPSALRHQAGRRPQTGRGDAARLRLRARGSG
jgi:hydrogenase expression/formation protein HypD